MLIPIPRANRAPLSLSLPETAVPAGVSLATIAITRFAWPNPGEIVGTLTTEFSFDNGATWPWVDMFQVGGGVITRNGLEVTESSKSFTLPQSNSTTRKVRGSVVTTATLDFGGRIEIV